MGNFALIRNNNWSAIIIDLVARALQDNSVTVTNDIIMESHQAGPNPSSEGASQHNAGK